MRYFIFTLLIISVTSCNYFDKKKVNTQDIINEELKTINWNNVDEYPTFDECKEAMTKEDRKLCFQNTLATYITKYLSEQLIVVTKDINDTIVIRFHVSEVGEISVLDISNTENIIEQIPNIDTLLVNSLKTLPKVHAAIKRAQEVKTEFKLPIVISVN